MLKHGRQRSKSFVEQVKDSFALQEASISKNSKGWQAYLTDNGRIAIS